MTRGRRMVLHVGNGEIAERHWRPVEFNLLLFSSFFCRERGNCRKALETCPAFLSWHQFLLSGTGKLPKGTGDLFSRSPSCLFNLCRERGNCRKALETKRRGRDCSRLDWRRERGNCRKALETGVGADAGKLTAEVGNGEIAERHWRPPRYVRIECRQYISRERGNCRKALETELFILLATGCFLFKSGTGKLPKGTGDLGGLNGHGGETRVGNGEIAERHWRLAALGAWRSRCRGRERGNCRKALETHS